VRVAPPLSIIEEKRSDQVAGRLGQQGQMAGLIQVRLNPLSLLFFARGELVGLGQEVLCLAADCLEEGDELRGII
jgi:hypothetical protein